ncbi:MAG: hypothetical protein JOZ54_02275, partial [Acidobacteria bacterium]|nr:hypothetical protein [Acidobacteriota bacterium]
MQLLDSAGRSVQPEKELCRGGEGAIFTVAGRSDVLAKLYHQKKDPVKEAKLAVMLGASNDALLRIASWPITTLRLPGSADVVGFLMPRCEGQELHQLYRPGSRKQKFPHADWRFLAQTARNIAAAVATIHATGLVIGDVNQRNVLVARDATVRILDCDSFQVRANGQLLYCPVGVAEFTPPELQNRPFHLTERTPNHDAFGLAILIFQLLFMGWHPYVGRFLADGEMDIARAIAERRFAHGKDSRRRLMEPPPHAVSFESMPPRLISLFEAAFVSDVRPSAQAWCDALDAARAELAVCSVEPMHQYSRHLPECLWCRLEKASGVFFFLGLQGARTGLDVSALWAAIVASTALPYEAPVRPMVTVTAASAPNVVWPRRIVGVLKILGGLALAGWVFTSPEWFPAFLLGVVVLALSPLPGRKEHRRRLEAFQQASAEWHRDYGAAEKAL